MNRMKIQNNENAFEMAAAIELDPALPSYGDARISVRVTSSGFSGSNEVWVSAQALNQFCLGLVSLERSLKGAAVLESISPKELGLRLFSATSRGHLALEGRTGYQVHREHGSYWHEVAFGFEFEPARLTSVVALSWVQSCARSGK